MKTAFTLIFALGFLLVNLAYAQDEGTKKVGILPVKYQDARQVDAANMITNLLYDNFTNGKRAKVINREFFSDLQNEKFLTSEIDFIDGETFSKTKSEGAKYLLVAKVATCKVEKKQGTNSNGQVSYYYQCYLNVGLRIINVETGETDNSYTLENKTGYFQDWGNTFKDRSTESGAIKIAVDDLQKGLTEFMNKYFCVEALVLKVKETKGDKLVSVLVGLGTDDGIERKHDFLVKEKSMLNDEPYYEQIGEVQIEEVNGKSLSTAKVVKGSQEIYAKLQAGATLVVTSKTK